MKKLFLTLVVFVLSSFILFAVDGDSEGQTIGNIVNTTDQITFTPSKAKTTITLDTSSSDSQYIEVGFSSTEIKTDDFTSAPGTITNDQIGLIASTDGTASYGGESANKIYAYYRVHYTGYTKIDILTSALTVTGGESINTKVSGTRKDLAENGGFSTGTTDSGNHTYVASTIYDQESNTTTPAADSILLTVATENYLSKPSGNYTGTITLSITTDEPQGQG